VRRLNTIFVALGLGVFLAVVAKIGWATVLYQLRAAWITVPALVGLSVLRLLLQTQSWRLALRDEGVSRSVGELVGIRLASQGMGYLSVLGPALSEPMKVKLLGNQWENSARATIVDSGLYWLSCIVVGLVGCVAATIVLAKSQYAGTLLATASFFLLVAALLFTKKPLLSSVVSLCGRRAPSWLNKGANLEKQIREFRKRHPKTMRSMLCMNTACQALAIAEAVIVMFHAKLPVHILTVLGIEAFTRVTKMTTGWIPARMGADESGAVAAFVAFGFAPAAGLMLALARRMRDLLWCAVGLTWLAWKSQQMKKEPIFVEGYSPCRSS
jgi:hypothetical protein